MGLFNDFQFELISQTSIVQYIEFQFENELSKVRRCLDVKDEENLYDNNIEYMANLVVACDKILDKNAKSYVPLKELPSIARNFDVREPIGEVISYCVETLEDGGYLGVRELKEELDENNRINGDEYAVYDFTEEQIKDIIEAAYVIKDYRINNRLEEVDEAIELLKTTIKLVDNSSSTNIFRQSFINVFSIFDAYVFEHLKQFFYMNPSELDSFLDIKNSEKVKISLDELLEFGSIEDLKAEMIQKQFSGRYLSELISKLKKYRPKLFDGIKYPMLMEMIERRNIHLHNKGFVDNKYYNGFNLYKFNVGDYAYIDRKYLFDVVFNAMSTFTTNMEKELPV